MEASSVQLHRLRFRPAPGLAFDLLTEDGQKAYLANVLKLQLPCDAEQLNRLQQFYSPAWLRTHHP